jgi:hypothetical protein
MPLNYLHFDSSDDGEGHGTWDAMASVKPPQLAAVLAEVHTVLAWCQAHAPGPCGPLDEGGAWDVEQQQTQEGDWVTVTLTLTGPEDWGRQMLVALGADAEAS